MARVERSVTVEAPVREVYDTWTQFEQFPEFMSSVDRIQQLDDKRLRWHVDVGGRALTFDTEITEQIPDARIAWRSTTEPVHSGAVDFHRLDDRRTEVDVLMEVAPEGIAAVVPGAEAVAETRLEHVVDGDLRRFKDVVERRGPSARGWRGEIRPTASGETMTMLDKVATGLVTVGALNWGLVGLARLDLVGRLLARRSFGQTNGRSRLVYGLVGAAGLYSTVRFAMLARHNRARS
jgi:uncharacterized membrane protein YuzA (DUF378 family)/ribosome-associated toxin RatA of RatAB toxin-antitoxin module